MTHILLSIEEIKRLKQQEIDRITKLWEDGKGCETIDENRFTCEFVYVNDDPELGYSHSVKQWDDLLHLPIGKEISLDEEDIAEKANKFAYGKEFNYCTSASDVIKGYKQALKDLL